MGCTPRRSPFSLIHSAEQDPPFYADDLAALATLLDLRGGLGHGMSSINKDLINHDLLAFIKA
jgi:hypothetical protein